MKVKDIIKICNGKLLCGDDELLVTKYSKDTRTINIGEVYVGIKGEKYDGNEYIADAFNKGASFAITDKVNLNLDEFINRTIVYVNNTIDAICELAKYKRDNFKGKVVGVTGSVGKTTTKDLISSVLETEYKVLKTEGSLNNNIGLPFCILNGIEADIWVIEMGMNNFGEISFLSKIAKPNISVITNIGTSHIGMLGSRENILKAKLEILEGMEIKKLIINNDNDLLHEYYLNNKEFITTVGINNDSNYNGKILNENEVEINNLKYKLFSCEEPLLIDSMLAYAVAKEFNINEKNIEYTLENFKQQGNRLKEEIASKGFLVINDAFNASYDSMKLAINYLSKFSNRKIIVLGDMLELGDYSKELHEEVGKLISSSSVDILLTVGENAKYINSKAMEENYKGVFKHFDNNDECLEYINKIIDKNDVILFKASKRMNFIDFCNKVLYI